MPESRHPHLDELKKIKDMQRQFHETVRLSIVEGTEDLVQKAEQLGKELGANIIALKEKLDPFEQELHLQEQYESQITLLDQSGLLETLSNGGKGIKAMDKDGKPTIEYPIPTSEEIIEKLISPEQREIFKTKIEQGFVKLLIVPFGLPLINIAQAYQKALQSHFDRQKLFHTKKEPTDPNEPITELHKDGPMYIWDKYNNADATGELVYEPKKLEKDNHQGKTKSEIVAQKGGFKVLLIEDMPNIPRKGNAIEKGGRTQIDTKGTTIAKYIEQGKDTPSPIEYLNALQTESKIANSPYYQEEPLTPEDQLIYALTHLEETDEVVDDYKGNGSISYQLGAYFLSSGDVPDAFWARGGRQFNLSGDDVGFRDGYCGVRSAVGVY